MKNFKNNARIGVLIGLACAIVLSLARFEAKCDTVRSGVLRLHIIANSDSDADQALKLKVRDNILKSTSIGFDKCSDLESAISVAHSETERLEKIVNKTIAENGFAYSSSVSVGEAYFETREYDDFTLPAGEYKSLIVRLGEGKGKNWWCVVFPCVCLPSASGELSDSVASAGVEIAENPQRYVMKFKACEWYENIKNKLKKENIKK